MAYAPHARHLLRSIKRAAPFAAACLASIAGLGCGSAPPPPSAPASVSVSAPVSVSVSVSAPVPVSAPASAPASASMSAAAPASAPRRRAKIRFDSGEFPFPAPLVDVILGGHPTTMIVDTGASHHVVAQWLVRELNLPLTSSGDRAVDHAGRVMKITRAENVGLTVSGWGSINVPFFLVASLPDPLRQLGIGGVLAPQTLAGEGRVMLLDFRGGFMSEEDPEDAARRLEASGGVPAISGARVCGGANEGSVLLVDALVDGSPATLKIDSGAERSSLLRTSAAGKLLLARALAKKKTTVGYAAAGSFVVPTAEDTPLKLGDFEATVDLNLDAGSSIAPCPSDGFLGLDVLRACTLVVQGEKTKGRCAPRSAP